MTNTVSATATNKDVFCTMFTGGFRDKLIYFVLWIVAVGACCQAVGRQLSPGLTVAGGRIIKDGRTYRGFGVNYYDLFVRVLHDPCDVSFEQGLQLLTGYRIPFARFNCGGFWPDEMRVYLKDKQRFFCLLDKVVKAAEDNHIGLICSLFWLVSTVPDLVGESCDQWGNPASKTQAFMRQYTRDIVMRYRHSPAIWGWEFGNEYNLRADLPNAARHRPPVAPAHGTPESRDEHDDLTRAMIRIAFSEFAREVRKYDSYRIILTGNSIPRASAWHQSREKSWTKDTPWQQLQILKSDNPDPIDVISVHYYPSNGCEIFRAMQYAAAIGKPLFVGEFGVSRRENPEREQFATMLKVLEDNQVPLAALWVYDFSWQKEWNVTVDNNRAYQLQALTDANQRMQRSMAAMVHTAADDKSDDGDIIPWKECLDQKPCWYGTFSAVRIADNLLLYQRQSGGWPKNIDFAVILQPPQYEQIIRNETKEDSTIDNQATCRPIRFLARVFLATGYRRYKMGVLAGLDYLFRGQYPNGGWPQFYPHATGYHRYITFNDNAMINVMTLLREVSQGQRPFGFIDEVRRRRASQAVQKGIDCILKCQVVIGGRRLAWCAQHDEVTFEPRPARSYEKISLSGKESVGIVEFLMGIDNPSPQVINAVEGAVSWFEEVRITGVRLLKKPRPDSPKGYDKVIVSDSNAGPLWARFYEIGTNRPIFCSRDGIVHYNLADISYERRNGYNWYTDAPRHLLEELYPAWKKKHAISD